MTIEWSPSGGILAPGEVGPIHEDGRIVVSLVGSNRAGVTVADLTLADKVDRVIEKKARR
jgi:hypothetical protein